VFVKDTWQINGGIQMNRDEILAKSRIENATQDERELQIYYRAGSIAKAVGCLLCVWISCFVTIISDNLGIVASACWSIYTGMTSVEYWIYAVRVKYKKLYWVWASVISIFFVLFIFFFVQDLIQWAIN
jgi:hypothetical protein